MLLYNARLLTMAGQAIEQGFLLIDPPLIRQVGQGSPGSLLTAGRTAIDLKGQWLVPGFIDAHSHIGLFTDGISKEGYDANESSDPITPHMQALDGLYQEDRCFQEALAYGVTSVMTGPGSANVLSGSFALVHTCGQTAEAMAQRQPAAMKAALGENPKKVHGAKNRSPVTRMASAALLRQALDQASAYRLKKEHAKADDKPFDKDPRWEALLPVLSGQIPLKIHAHRSDDILTGVRIANVFGLRYTLDHCTEGYRIADVLARVYQAGQADGHGQGLAGQGRLEGIITGPLLTDRSKPELARSALENPAVLVAAGLPVAIATDHPVTPQQHLALSAAAAVRCGLDEVDALAAITLQAAKICGVGAELGSLEAGKQADFSVFTDHPFHYRCRTRMVFIKGACVWQAGDGAPC